jgi:hypothetical protein
MRRQHKRSHKPLRRVLLAALSILSHVAAIIGTIVAAMDALHHW